MKKETFRCKWGVSRAIRLRTGETLGLRWELTGAFGYVVATQGGRRCGEAVNSGNSFYARMAELVDAPDLGSGSERSGGSSPLSRTAISST
jgi:hypothetical protein